MTGAIAAVASSAGVVSGGGGGGVVPNTIAWSDIFGEDSGSTQIALVTGFTGSIQVSATQTGAAQLAYILNGTYAAYQGAFTLRPNNTLGWSIVSTSTADQSGVVTVTNNTNGATLDTFNYLVYSSRGLRL